MRIRRLGPADAEAFRALRLEALRDAPAAFGSDYHATLRQPLDAFKRRLENAHMLAAEDAGALIGCLSLSFDDNPKTAHRGVITAVFVRADHRRKGIAQALMAQAQTVAAAQGLAQLELFVSDAMPGALSFYQAQGFVEAGSIPDALRVDGQSYGERLMIKPVTDITGGAA